MFLPNDGVEFGRLLTRLTAFFLPAVRSALAVDGVALAPAKLQDAAERLATSWLVFIRCYGTTASGEIDVTALDDRLLPNGDVEAFYACFHERPSALNEEQAERALRFARKLLEGAFAAPDGARELIRLLQEQPDIRRN